VILLVVAVAEWTSLKAVERAFAELLFRDARNAAEVMIEACRTVYQFQVIREFERKIVLMQAANQVPDSVTQEDLEFITERERLPLALLTDLEGSIISGSGPISPEIQLALGNLREELSGVYEGALDADTFGIDLQLPLTTGPKGMAMRVANGVVLLFAPDPLIPEREELTIGHMIRRFGENPRVRYIALQDESGFIFANRSRLGDDSPLELTRLEEDSFLVAVYEQGKPDYRYHNLGSERIFEMAIRFPAMGRYRGVLRTGLSTSDHDRLLRGYAIQLGIVLLSALIISVIAISLLLTTKRLAIQKGLSDAILSETSAACVAIDSDGLINLFNPGAARIFRINPQNAIGKAVEDILSGDPLMLCDSIDRGSGRTFRADLNIGKESRVLDVSTGILPDGGAFAVSEDVTNMMQLKKDAAANEHLRALGELAAGVAHEIRNPLNAIGIAAQRLETEFDPVEDAEGYTELLSGLRTEIHRLDRVIREFIGLSAPMAPDLIRQPIKPLLDNIIDGAALRSKCAGIQFEADISDCREVAYDSSQLEKAILNLVKNAIEATPVGGKIKIRAFSRNEDVHIIIWDNGPPIPDKIRSKLGKPFITSGKEGGTGIGLFVAFRIIRDHGGRIEVDSDKDGTSFEIIIPGGSR